MRDLAELKLLPYGRGREYKKPTPKEITWLGNRCGANLPDTYRQFLMETNGGAPVLNCFPGDPRVVLTNFLHLSLEPQSILWDTENILWNVKQTSINPKLKRMVPIALDADGNMVLIDLRLGRFGRVLFYRLDDSSLTLLTMDFETFVDSLEEGEKNY